MSCPTCDTGEHDWRDLGPVNQCQCCHQYQANQTGETKGENHADKQSGKRTMDA